jgi:PAS domain S-box-containing protein
MPDLSGLSVKHLQKIIHELHVHQVELEMQNEELRRTSLDLELSRIKYRDLYDFAPVGYLTVDSKGIVLEANLTSTMLLGRDRQEVVGRPVSRFIFNQDSDIFHLMFHKMFETNYKQICELRFYRKDLSLFEAQLEGSVSEEGESIPRYARLILSDITERKQSEHALRQSNKRYMDLTELLPQLVYEADKNGILTFANSATLNALGYTAGEAIDRLSVADVVVPEDRETVRRHVEKLINGQKLSILQCSLLAKDGTTLPVLVYSSPIYDELRITGIRGVAIDVSPLKKAEEEREQLREQLYRSEKLAALGTLVGGVAHDFNNMLQIIVGYSEIVMDDAEKGKADYSSAKAIFKTAQEGAELVRKLMSLAQKSNAFLQPLDLNERLREIHAVLNRTLPLSIHVGLDLTGDRAIIRADQNQIDKIVMNLASNATEAMPNGGRIRIATRKVVLDADQVRNKDGLRPGEYIELAVSDNGQGIDRRLIGKIFDPFFSTKQRGSTRGTGLGLSVARGIAQQHGGQITCESQPGKGSEFKVYFPAI